MPNLKIVIEGLTFGFDKTNISKESEVILSKALNTLESYLNVHVEISGHTVPNTSKENRQKNTKNSFYKFLLLEVLLIISLYLFCFISSSASSYNTAY